MEVGVVASGFAHLLVSQISTRLVTFSLNLLIARHLTPEEYGLSSIQFHLIITTILFLSREGFRRGCLRFKPESSKDHAVDTRRVLSVAWLVVPIGMAMSAVVCAGVLFMRDSSAPGASAYAWAVGIHGAAAVLEILSEPFYILASVNLQFKLRVVMDTLTLITKSLVTLFLVSQTSVTPALAFSAAQVGFSGVALVGYAIYGAQMLRQAGGKQKGQQPRANRYGPVEKEVLWMSGLFSLQAAEKLVLAEGSKLVLVGAQSRYNQGVYGLVNNLGSLVVRTLFQPLEEVAFTAFSRCQVSSEDMQGLRQQAQVLGALVKAVALLGLLAVSFGPSYSYSLLRLVYGTRWSETEAPMVLSCYCAYILLLAVNGVTEAFVHSVLDRRSLQQSNLLMVLFSGLHLGACLLLIPQLGATGLVAADSLNMAVRITASCWYINRHFKALPGFAVIQLLPSPLTAAAAAVAGVVCWLSNSTIMGGAAAATPTRAFLTRAACHIGVGAVCLVAFVLVILKSEKATISAVRSLRNGKGRPQGGEAASADGKSGQQNQDRDAASIDKKKAK